MNRLSTAFVVGAMALSTCAFAADKAGQDCSKLSGKEKDQCTQATPAGPVDMQSGTQKKGTSDAAKERDQQKQANQASTPPQNNDTVGHPHERASTGEAQTGAKPAKKSAAKKAAPEQSKDTTGHPDERRATGEAQTGQAPGEGSPRKTQ